MFVVNKKRFSVRHFDEYKKQLLTAQQEALNILGCYIVEILRLWSFQANIGTHICEFCRELVTKDFYDLVGYIKAISY